jgi:hypothetical protein
MDYHQNWRRKSANREDKKHLKRKLNQVPPPSVEAVNKIRIKQGQPRQERDQPYSTKGMESVYHQYKLTHGGQGPNTSQEVSRSRSH